MFVSKEHKIDVNAKFFKILNNCEYIQASLYNLFQEVVGCVTYNFIWTLQSKQV